MASARHRSPSNETTESQPKYMTPDRSWAADQAIVLTPVSRDVKTRVGGIPPYSWFQTGPAPPAEAGASKAASPRRMPTTEVRAARGRAEMAPGDRRGLFRGRPHPGGIGTNRPGPPGRWGARGAGEG